MRLNFIDQNEIEEMLSEYYDFSNFTDDQWRELDLAIQNECTKRGISPTDDYEEYARVCDVCVERTLKK